MDQTEKHFQIMIYLMLVFFCVNMGLEIMASVKIAVAPSAIATAHDAFLSFFGVAIGMFRGMTPQGSIDNQSNSNVRSIVTTDIHSEKDTPSELAPLNQPKS